MKKSLRISLPFIVGLVAACVDPPVEPGTAALRAGTDLVLDATWEPRSGEVIDCGGNAIRPRTPADENGGLSVPDTLIFLGPGVRGVHIRNCTLEATFPIVALGGGSHVISRNRIHASSRGVWLFSSSHNVLAENVLRTSGRNVQINGDSDGTLVSRNDIGFVAGAASVDGNPGMTYPEAPGGVGVGTFTYPGVNNLIVNGRVHQDVTSFDTRPERTRILRNTIHNEGGELGIIFATRSSHGFAHRNQVHGGGLGLAVFGYEDFAWFVDEPGTCSGDPTMRCVDDPFDPTVGCALPGQEPRGECEGTTWKQGGGRVIAPSFVENQVSGTDIGVLAGLTDGLRVEANDLEGGWAGMLLWGYALHESSIFGNRAAGYEVGLVLEDDNMNGDAAHGLDVAYNDFGDNQRLFDAYSLVFNEDWEVVDVVAYVEPASLRDNWWGEACGIPANPEWWPATVSPTPAAEPIAMAWRDGRADDVPRCAP